MGPTPIRPRDEPSNVFFVSNPEPNFFQRKCLRSTAEYKIISANEISVHNICYKKNDETEDITGVAKIPDSKVPAKLRVKFSFYQRGDYWIIDLDPNYQWAVVSAPRKKSLFILARTVPMNAALQQEIISKLKDKGFNTDELIFDQY